ncbi:tyrosine-type recombinase/integrase, partial [Bacteroides uniformis]
GGTLPNAQQKTRIFFVLMFMLRGIPFVDLAYLHKRDLQGNILSYRRRKTGRALTVSLTPEAMQMVRIIANKDKDSPYLFPILQSEEGSEAAYREYQSALRAFNQRLAVLRQCLGMQSALSSYAARHTWATMAYHCEIHPGIISEAMGHSSITVTETYLKPFSNRKIDEANQRVISFVRSGACTV